MGEGMEWAWGNSSGGETYPVYWEDENGQHEGERGLTAAVTFAEEGSDVVLRVSAVIPMDTINPEIGNDGVDFEYWIEDVSTTSASDYTNIASTWVQDRARVYSDGSPGDAIISIPTTDDSLAEHTESFRIHIREQNVSGTDFVVEGDIYDNDNAPNPATVTAVAEPAVEGSDVVLDVGADVALRYEYYVADVSAVQGTDYTDPNNTSSSNWAIISSGGLVTFQTFTTTDNSNYEPTQSFAIHVRVVGDPDSEVVLEADILDDLPDTVYVAGPTTVYSYDSFDHLVRRSYDDDGIGNDTATDTFYSWLGNQIALQFNGNSASSLSHRYDWGPAVDQIMADETVTSLSSAGSVIWPCRSAWQHRRFGDLQRRHDNNCQSSPFRQLRQNRHPKRHRNDAVRLHRRCSTLPSVCSTTASGGTMRQRGAVESRPERLQRW